jgi:hypothetical protein
VQASSSEYTYDSVYVLYYKQGLSADISQYIQSLCAYIIYKLHCDLAGLEAWHARHFSVLYDGMCAILLYCICFCIVYYIDACAHIERKLPCRPRAWRICLTKSSHRGCKLIQTALRRPCMTFRTSLCVGVKKIKN